MILAKIYLIIFHLILKYFIKYLIELNIVEDFSKQFLIITLILKYLDIEIKFTSKIYL